MRTTESGQSFHLLLDIAVILKRSGVDYAVIGAMAASFHGAMRATLDADALLSLTPRSLGTLQPEFKKAGYKTKFRQGDAEDPIQAVLELSDRFGNRVDLLVGIRGMDPAAFERTVETRYADEKLRMIGLEDFIAMKIFAGSPKDLEDARQAMKVSEKSLNRSRLEKLTARFGKASLKILKRMMENP